MFQKNKIAQAVIVVTSAAYSLNSQAQLEEILVTATKREASLQEVPVAVSALTEESLDQRGVANFSDYLIQLPNVSAGGSGPGQNTIYIRGVASTTPNLTTAGVAGLSPNVALYLDEQPMTQPGRNLDVYVADVNRVEVLAGPQGTLFGASSQAGVVRLITNEPDTSGLYGNVKAGASWMRDGEMNNNVNATLNLPITDTFAVRGVVFSDNKGGFIDNVHSTRSTAESARFRPAGTVRSNGTAVKSFRGGFQAGADLSNVRFIDADNASLVEEDFNDTSYQGARVSALWDINPDWDLRVGAMQQKIDTEGTFYADPNLDDFEIQRFEAENMQDEFTNYNWTLEGRLGQLEVLYTGAFTERNTDQRIDYSDYLFIGQYIPYYICDYYVSYTSYSPAGAGIPSGTCQSPNLYVKSKTKAEFQTHEFRIATDSDARVRLTAGAFISDLDLKERNDFAYPGNKAIDVWGAGAGDGFGFTNNYNYDHYTGYNPGAGPYPADTIFRNDVQRTDKNVGIFGEVGFDLSDNLALTVGARWYDYEVDLLGSANSSFCNMGSSDANAYGTNINDIYDGDGEVTWSYSGCGFSGHPVYSMSNPPDQDDPNYTRIMNTINAPDKAQDDGVISKVSLSWQPNDDQLWYLTWSEGFRTGLLNRPGGAYQSATNYTVPFDVKSDAVDNIELGWKLDLLDNSLRFNGSAFMIDITDLQTTIFDTSIVNLFFSDNAADAEVRGLEGDLTYVPSDELMLGAAFSILDTEITAVKTPTGDVTVGSELAYAPKFQSSLWARYEWPMAKGWRGHFMPSVSHSAKSYSDIISINSMEIDSWTMMNLSVGISDGGWMVEGFINNLTNEKVAQGANYVNDRERVAYAPPTTAGVRFSYEF
jgi:iron complex outermembrane receptor protein